MLTVGSLFSGIGGFDLGLERAGMRVIWQSEIDPYASAVLRKHWPGVPNLGDIRGIKRSNVCDAIIEHGRQGRPRRPTPASAWESIAKRAFPNVLCGGFPCQDISNAGKRAGIDGERSGLWSEFARLIGELRPRYAIMENVAALLGRGLERVLGDLAALGYDAEWHCIPASAVGAPHRRDRVWIVAYAARVDGERSIGSGNFGERSEMPLRDSGRSRGTTDVADADQPRLPIGGMLARLLGRAGGTDEGQDASLGRENQDTTSWDRGSGNQDAGWEFEPEFRGMAYGLSARLHGDLNGRQRMGSLGDTLGEPETDLRSVWRDIASRSASQGSQPDEQLARELADRLPDLSHALALGRGQGTVATASRFLHRLRQACEAVGAVRDASQPTVEAWLALSDQEAGGAYMAACGYTDWPAGEWLGVPRVAHGVPKRVDRLRCLGNAIVPQVAEIIGRAIVAADVEGVEKRAAIPAETNTSRDSNNFLITQDF